MRFIVSDYLDCSRCRLHETRRNIVFGCGRVPADLLFIGDSPSDPEDLLAQFMIGVKGRIFRHALEVGAILAGMNEPPSYFITGLTACRACSHTVDRSPTFEEVWACYPRLTATYARVEPKRVVFIGAPARQLLGSAWPEAKCLPSPTSIIRSGGSTGPMFRQCARELCNLFQEVSNVKTN